MKFSTMKYMKYNGGYDKPFLFTGEFDIIVLNLDNVVSIQYGNFYDKTCYKVTMINNVKYYINHSEYVNNFSLLI